MGHQPPEQLVVVRLRRPICTNTPKLTELVSFDRFPVAVREHQVLTPGGAKGQPGHAMDPKLARAGREELLVGSLLPSRTYGLSAGFKF